MANKQITDKTYCVMLKGGFKTYLTPDQAEFLSKQFEAGKEVVRVPSQTDFKTFFKFGIDFILPAGEIEREEKIKRGDWQCDYGHWHRRGEECGHAEAARYSAGGK